MKAYTKDNIVYLVQYNTINIYKKQDNLDLKYLAHLHLCRTNQKSYEEVCTEEDVISFIGILLNI